MKKLLLLVALAPMFAADPAGFVLWKSSDLKSYEKKLTPKMNDKKLATEQLVNFGNHSTMVAHREGDGEAELHEKMADLFVVQSGEGTLVVGGTVPGGKTTAPGEIRGPSIQGGEHKKLGPGDVVHIPANVPHQVLVAPGKQFTYFVMKVEAK
jgi:mannose-6-phosphate isomerase-like protein (cupin superfamily)